MADGKLAFVTGATGGIGSEVAAALRRRGWRVRALVRDPRRAAAIGLAGVEWVEGDAMLRTDMEAAASGADVVFHGANPPGYRDWRGLAVPMWRNAIAAALAAEARLIVPGSVYVYGRDSAPLVAEAAPRHPTTRKGKIRVEMEAMLLDAAGAGLRSLVIRAGDFFGPSAPNMWVSKLMLRGGAEPRSVVTPELSGAGHAWAYLPDLAQAVAMLAERERSLAVVERLHFRGHALTGRAMAEAVQREVGGVPIRPFNWLPVYLGAPFVTFLREVIEMRYLWRTTLLLDNARLVELLGPEPHTDLGEAVAATRGALRVGRAAPAALAFGR